MTSLRVTKYTEKQAVRLVYGFIRHAKHQYEELRHKKPEEIVSILNSYQINYGRVIYQLMENHNNPIPMFESIEFEPVLHYEGLPGATISSISEDGILITKHQVENSKAGFTRDEFLSNVYSSIEARDTAIQTASVDHLYSAIQKGLTAIDYFLDINMNLYNQRAGIEGRDTFETRKKTKQGKFIRYSLEEKIEVWTKVLSERRFDVTVHEGWKSTKELIKFRNNVIVHPKPSQSVNSVFQIAELLNSYTKGIAGLIHTQHIEFGVYSPPRVIRAAFFPEVVAE